MDLRSEARLRIAGVIVASAINILKNKVPDIQEELSAINCGGCLLFGFALKKELAKHGVKSDLVLVNVGNYSTKTVEQFIGVTGCKGINSAFQKSVKHHEVIRRLQPYYCFGHVAVRVGGLLFDSTGLTKFKAISKPLTDKTCEVLIGADAWNHNFKLINSYNHDIIGTIEEFLTHAFEGVR